MKIRDTTGLHQTQIGFTKIPQEKYKRLVYSFNFGNRQGVEHNTGTISSIKENCMDNEPISTTERWHLHEEIHGKQSYNDILNLIKINQKQLSKLRGHPVIAYLTAINMNALPGQISLNDKDIKDFMSLISDIDKDEKEIDVILHSHGGFIESAHIIVELLRSRFDKVNFLIPYSAHSAASMMCLSADQIIMTPESSLSPFDAQVMSPDSGNYLPVNVMLECAKEAKQSYNPFNLFITRNSYKNWTKEMAKNTIQFCKLSDSKSKSYPLYWLMKYMFKSCRRDNQFFITFLFMPFWKRFTPNGRKANRIVNLFINIGINLSHSTPIMYNDLKSVGLKVFKAEGELLSLMRETYQLADNLFDRSNIKKLYTNSNDKSFYTYLINSKEETST